MRDHLPRRRQLYTIVACGYDGYGSPYGSRGCLVRIAAGAHAMIRIPPDRIEHVAVNDSPQPLHVPQPEPEHFVELVEPNLRQAPLCLRAQVIGGDELALRRVMWVDPGVSA